MHLSRDGSTWIAHPPAKLNLMFEVLARREDGYHEIESLLCPLALCDTLTASPRDGPEIVLECRWAQADPGATAAVNLPAGPTNLVYRAAALLQQAAGVARGLQLSLVKRIPLQAGLGGGSSDAAAALRLANRAWELNWPLERLLTLAAQLGSDVPFFLYDAPAICRGRGERVEPVAGLPALHVVLAKPPVGLATAEVYRACRPATEPRRAATLVHALRGGDVRAGRFLTNRLTPAAETLSPWMKRLDEELSRLRLAGHSMTGSGACWFGLCRNARHARRMATVLRGRGMGWVCATRSV